MQEHNVKYQPKMHNRVHLAVSKYITGNRLQLVLHDFTHYMRGEPHPVSSYHIVLTSQDPINLCRYVLASEKSKTYTPQTGAAQAPYLPSY